MADGHASDDDLGSTLSLLAEASFLVRMLLSRCGWTGSAFAQPDGALEACRAVRRNAAAQWGPDAARESVQRASHLPRTPRASSAEAAWAPPPALAPISMGGPHPVPTTSYPMHTDGPPDPARLARGLATLPAPVTGGAASLLGAARMPVGPPSNSPAASGALASAGMPAAWRRADLAPSDSGPGALPALSFLGAPAASRPAPGGAPGPAGAWSPSSFGASLAQPRGAHAGATTDAARTSFGLSEPTSSLETYLAAIAKELGKQGRHHEDAAGATKGTLASIGREAGQCVFITRAADHLTVSLCPGIVEKDAFHALREAGEVARPLLRKLQLRVNLTNAVCYACAGFAWGGRDHRSLPDNIAPR